MVAQTELCFPKFMGSFLDHEVTTSFMLLFQSSLIICNLQADQSQDFLCMMEWNCRQWALWRRGFKKHSGPPRSTLKDLQSIWTINCRIKTGQIWSIFLVRSLSITDHQQIFDGLQVGRRGNNLCSKAGVPISIFKWDPKQILVLMDVRRLPANKIWGL